jgi:HTH-type transcriptional regulator / antitoxin HigA
MNLPEEDKVIAPPGDFLKQEMKKRGWTQGVMARVIGRTAATISGIIQGRRSITIQTAQELAAAFGTSPSLWLARELDFQLAQEGRPIGEIEEIQKLAKLFEYAPVKEMERRGWIKEADSAHLIEAELRKFFEKDSLGDESIVNVAARQSSSDSQLSAAQKAWCVQAKRIAREVHVAPYNRKDLKRAMGDIRQFAVSPEGARHVPRFLAENGVRLVVVENLPGTRMDGAALWIDGSPVIALSLRFDRIDWFWHTLLHEIGHILNCDVGEEAHDIEFGGAGNTGATIDPEKERKADSFAAGSLIPSNDLDSFIQRVRPRYSKARVNQFANRIKIHPGVIIGQLQFRGEIQFSANREMLVKVRQIVVDNAMTDGFGVFR